jgi:hypothetical protein
MSEALLAWYADHDVIEIVIPGEGMVAVCARCGKPPALDGHCQCPEDRDDDREDG